MVAVGGEIWVDVDADGGCGAAGVATVLGRDAIVELVAGVVVPDDTVGDCAVTTAQGVVGSFVLSNRAVDNIAVTVVYGVTLIVIGIVICLPCSSS